LGRRGRSRLGRRGEAITSEAKDGEVAAARDFDEDGLALALPGEIAFQAQAEVAGFGADDAVVAGVVVGWPAEDAVTDQGLADLAGLASQVAIHYISKEGTESLGAPEFPAGGDTLRQRAALLSGRLATVLQVDLRLGRQGKNPSTCDQYTVLEQV
jgi:hypothetical protein